MIQILENETWSSDRKSIEKRHADSAKCRRCGKIYRTGDMSKFFSGNARCPDCGGQGDLLGGRKLQGVDHSGYPHDYQLSFLPGQK